MPQATTRISSGMTLLLGVFLASLFNGCAVHYYDKQSGTEHLWGLGRVAWNKRVETNGWVSIRTGLVSPGLSIGTGPTFAGVALGGISHESVRVVTETEASKMQARANGAELTEATAGRWVLGHILMSAPSETKRVLVTAKALAGLKLAFDEGRPVMACGLAASQVTELFDPNAWLIIEQRSAGWPHFMFHDAGIVFSTNFNSITLND
jgi:hypothetical protein